MRQDTFQQDNAADAVDTMVGQWRRERPDLDPSGKEITGRILRLASLFGAAYSAVFGELGLKDGDYGVLAALRRSGAHAELTPTDLARQRMMTSGGMTAVIDRLERQGLVARSPNPQDRRGTLIRLTDTGRELVDRAMEVHTQAEHALVAGLDEGEREQLGVLLRKLLLSVERDPA
jgi:DNA-binding MarR family transcriptional regulator